MLANVAIVVVSILLCVVLVKSYLLSTPVDQHTVASLPAASKMIPRGMPVSVADVDWQKSGKTLLLALSTTCHFCTDSAAFYQRLARENRNARLVAVIPQSVSEGQAYLKSLGVAVNEVKQLPLDALGVSGTPTLILVDNNGNVENVWVGLLSADKERDVISHLQSSAAE